MSYSAIVGFKSASYYEVLTAEDNTLPSSLLCQPPIIFRVRGESEAAATAHAFSSKRKLGVKESLGEDKGEGFFEFKHQTDDQCVKNKVCITALDSYISGISLICGVRECTRKTEHALIHQSKTILLVICAS